MRLSDLLQMGLANLWRTRLRTFLTTLGVIIGIGALVAMVSFGTGMQKNVTQIFYDNDLFTSLRVLPVKIDLNRALSGDVGAAMGSMKSAQTINDTTLQILRLMPEVSIAFPEIVFSVKVRYRGEEMRTELRALPRAMRHYPPWSEMGWGRFFSSDSAPEIILSERQLHTLNIHLPDGMMASARSDSSIRTKTVPADSLLGSEIEVVTLVLDVEKIAANPLVAMMNPPFREQVTRLKICGIKKSGNGFESPQAGSNALIPIDLAKRLPRFEFSSMRSMLGDAGLKKGGYNALYVRVHNLHQLAAVRGRVEEMGFGVIALADQLEEIKRGFIFVDTALGAVGVIALIVAALGIINTMVMSILERTREIGIMKAVGGSEGQIKGLFFIEAAFIGLFGGIFGVLLGWGVTRIANFIANLYVRHQGTTGHFELFYLPAWLILGAVGFAVVVSLLAGLYPAMRAARINPVEALRHD